jgi:hypothetical protein
VSGGEVTGDWGLGTGNWGLGILDYWNTLAKRDSVLHKSLSLSPLLARQAGKTGQFAHAVFQKRSNSRHMGQVPKFHKCKWSERLATAMKRLALLPPLPPVLKACGGTPIVRFCSLVFDRHNSLNLAEIRILFVLFDNVRSAFIRAHERCFDEDDKSTVGTLMRVSRGFCEGDSRGTANDR